MYSCDQCEHQASIQRSLTKHKLLKHDGEIFSCDHCEQTSSYFTVGYSCDQCEYKDTNQTSLNKLDTNQTSLNKHKETKHEGARCSCDEC